MSAQKRVNSLAEVYEKLIGDGSCESQEHRKQNEWIWEYVLKNCQDFQLTTLLTDALPIPNTSKIKKLALLKLISLDFKGGNLWERDLFALQGYQDLISSERLASGEKDPDIVETKAGELEVHVKAELALEHLRNGKEDFTSFNNAVEKYWGEIVPDSQAPEVPNSLEEISQSMKADMWSLRINPRLKLYFLDKYKAEETQRLLEEFLELAWETIGLVFLEKAEQDILNGRYKPMDDKHQGVGYDNGRQNKRVRKTLLSSLEGEKTPESRSEGKDNSPRNVPPPWTVQEQTPERRKRKRVCGDEELGPAVEKAFNELKQNQQELKKTVSDPLPEAIEIVKKLRGGTDDQPATDANASVEQDGARSDQNGSKQKFNVMERNPTARTHQWEEDDIEMSPQDKSPSASKRLNLRSASAKKLSPINVASLPRRRKAHKWTVEEEEALRRGIEQYGKGRWKIILQSNSEIFGNRTEVDLKDKWRNIEKAEGIKRD